MINNLKTFLGVIAFSFAVVSMLLDYRGVRPGAEYEPLVTSGSAPALVMRAQAMRPV